MFLKEVRLIRQLGFLSWSHGFVDAKLIQPARQMTCRQVAVAVGVGAWGGVFPVPPCTSPATFGCIMFYSAGVPKAQRFNVPMISIAMVLNELILPLDLLMMPGFICVGQEAYSRLTDPEFLPQERVKIRRRNTERVNVMAEEMHDDLTASLQRFGKQFAVGAAAWAVATPAILGSIRCLGAVSRIVAKK